MADRVIAAVEGQGEPAPRPLPEPAVAREWKEDSSAAPFTECARQIGEYLEGRRKSFDLPVAPEGSEFQRLVYVDLATKKETPVAARISASGLRDLTLAESSNSRTPEFKTNRHHQASILVPASRLVPRDDGMATRARALYEELRRYQVVEHDDSGQIGRRYRRQDEIGTPWAFTVDEQTLEDETVTVRDRDSLAQERLPISGVRAWLDDALERDWSSPQSG